MQSDKDLSSPADTIHQRWGDDVPPVDKRWLYIPRGYGEAQSAGPREREIAVNLTTKAGTGRGGPIASSDRKTRDGAQESETSEKRNGQMGQNPRCHTSNKHRINGRGTRRSKGGKTRARLLPGLLQPQLAVRLVLPFPGHEPQTRAAARPPSGLARRCTCLHPRHFAHFCSTAAANTTPYRRFSVVV